MDEGREEGLKSKKELKEGGKRKRTDDEDSVMRRSGRITPLLSFVWQSNVRCETVLLVAMTEKMITQYASDIPQGLLFRGTRYGECTMPYQSN